MASKGLGSGELKSGSWIREVREVRDQGNCGQEGWGWGQES